MGAVELTILLLVLVLAGVPIAWALGGASLLYLVVNDISAIIALQRLSSSINSFPLLAIPLFILAGEIMNAGGITRRIIGLAEAVVGHLTVGLARVNVLASLVFSGMSGSAVADTSALGTVLIPSMAERGYDRSFAGGITAASATIGPIVPPSIPLIVYGIVAGVSITDLFLAGVLPGLAMTIALLVMVGIAGRGQTEVAVREFSVAELRRSLLHGVAPALLPALIIGGIVGGWFTATEAAGVAVGYALLLGFTYQELTPRRLAGVIGRTAIQSSVLAVIIAFAGLFGWILTLERVPMMLAEALIAITDQPLFILLLINVLLLILGLFLEANTAILLLAPVLVPTVVELGIDPVHFGIVMVLNLMIGLITPPVGGCLYVVSRVGDIAFEDVVRSVRPYFLPLLLVLALVTFVPTFVLWLPELVR